MEVSQAQIQALVEEIKEGMFPNIDPYSLVSPSAYDTAWLAMIPDSNQPMFKDCLTWVLGNQREDGGWGVCDGHGSPTIESLPATIACSIVLKRWNAAKTDINRGLAFVRENLERLLGENYGSYPRWLLITFPAMVELARTVGLEIDFAEKLNGVMTDIFCQRQQILETEELVDKYRYPPLLAYLEALPPSYDTSPEQILKHLSDDGSLFQSPSATARAFMATGNRNCLAYLKSLVQSQKCARNGAVPPTHRMDEDLTKLCIVNQLQRLGLAEHFDLEIKEVLAQVYRNYKNEESSERPISSVPTQLYKDSLAFQLLRMDGYSVSPRIFCWFLQNQEIRDGIEMDHVYFASVMLNVLRATDLMFPEECELEEARSFARKSLKKTISSAANIGQDDCAILSFQRMIQHELENPWLTRPEHLEHRKWIEENDSNALWMGKNSPHRLSCSHNDKLMQLATRNYEFRQSLYRNELEELKRWSKDWGLTDVGFGREKTTYCYFAATAAVYVSSSYDSYIRLLMAKSAIIITVADDFFDMRGSLNELKILTDAVKRWDVEGLNGHSKTIFHALDDTVREAGEIHLRERGSDITNELQDIWYETFAAWLTEAKWSKSGHIPSKDEYLETGMISIATHTILLKASCFLNPSLPSYKLRPKQYETLTKLLMFVPRLLNDMQSYQKEQKDGKTNFVLLHLKENPEADIEDSIAYVREMVTTKGKEVLEHALMDGFSDLPKPCKRLHLSCLKVFYMFFNSSNRYDSDSAMLDDIQKAIYTPLNVKTTKPSKPAIHLPLPLPVSAPSHVPLDSRPKKECNNNEQLMSLRSALQTLQQQEKPCCGGALLANFKKWI